MELTATPAVVESVWHGGVYTDLGLCSKGSGGQMLWSQHSGLLACVFLGISHLQFGNTVNIVSFFIIGLGSFRTNVSLDFGTNSLS